MGELGELLELMATARNRYRALSATAVEPSRWRKGSVWFVSDSVLLTLMRPGADGEELLELAESMVPVEI